MDDTLVEIILLVHGNRDLIPLAVPELLVEEDRVDSKTWSISNPRSES